jgi:hypothetical protein
MKSGPRLASAILATGAVLLGFAAPTEAVPLTTFGRPVEALGSSIAAIPTCPATEGQVCFDVATGTTTFFIPVDPAKKGVFGVTPVGNGRTAGTFADTGTGTGLAADPPALRMFLSFSPVAVPATSARLDLTFRDLDLSGVNDPPGFFESVQFFSDDGSPMSPLITVNGQSGQVPLAFTVSGNSTSQAIAFPDITALVENPFFAELRFNSQSSFRGKNTSEALTAVLTSVPALEASQAVPEPPALFLLAGGALGWLAYRRFKR